MADTRLTPPSPLALFIAESAYRAVQVTGEFFQRITRRRPALAPRTRGELIDEILRSQRCRCGGTCRHCQHIINDVIGG